MEATIYQQQHIITHYEVDVTGTLTPAMLMNIVLMVSEGQTEVLGVGEAYLAEQSLGWVVTQYKIAIERMPKVGENVTVATRATEYNRYFAFREFWLTDQDGVELVHVDSIWVVMDRQTRKMVSIPDDIIAPFDSKEVKLTPRLGRPKHLNDDEQLMEKRYRVRYFDIDQNGHVNNAHYFDWLLDALPMSFLSRHQLVALNIRFENEVQYHQDVVSQAALVTDNQEPIITKHRIQLADGGVATEAECHWKPVGNTL